MAKRRSLLLRENVRSPGAHKVDREKGVIYGVKVIGIESANGRRYTRQALKLATKLYEGVKVNFDHPTDPDDPRSSYDRFGKLVNVRFKDGDDSEAGLYGDLLFLTAHPMATRICEAAADQEKADFYGLSHNAQGLGSMADDGVYVVEEITEVRHVDIVADAATTKSLYESQQKSPMKRTLSQWLVECDLDDKVKAKMQEMVEADEMPDVEMDLPSDDVEPTDALSQGIYDAILAICKDDGMDAQTKAKKITKILKTHEQLLGHVSDDEEPVEESDDEESKEDDMAEGEGEGDDDKKKKDDVAEGKTKPKTPAAPAVDEKDARIAELERQVKARELCESASIVPDKVLLKALARCTDETEMQELIEREQTGKNRPKSQAPGGNPARKLVPKNAEEFSDLLS